MKKIFSIIFVAIFCLANFAHAKTETSTTDAESAVIYGKQVGGTLTAVQVDSSGKLVLPTISASGINWTDVKSAQIQTAGINWTSIKNSEIQRSGINWTSLNGDIQNTGINWTSAGIANGSFIKSTGTGITGDANAYAVAGAPGASTYRSVTVNSTGGVTAGTNPTTFSGYGLSDTSANLAAALTDESGTGAAIFATNPTLNNVGIGTTFNTTSALTVMSGNVGIGTWLPDQKLGVYGGGVNVRSSSIASNFIEISNSRQVQIDAANKKIHFGTTSSVDADFVIGSYSSNINIASAGTAINISGANVGIGSTIAGQALDVQGTIRASGTLILTGIASDSGKTDATICEDTTVHQLYSGSGTLGICLGTSSARYKHDIIPMKEGLTQLLKLRPVNFFYKDGYGDNGVKQQYGLIAEEVKDIIPGIVAFDKDGVPNSVDLLATVPMLIKATQEQHHQFVLALIFFLGLILLILSFMLRKLK